MTQEYVSDFAEAWRRFEAASSVRLMQETLEWEWTRGREEYAAFLIEVTDPAVREHIAGVLEAISDVPGVEPFPEAYWHATIKGVGFITEEPRLEDDVSPGELERMAEEARPLLEAEGAFGARIGPVNAFAEVVFMEVEDGGVIRSLNGRLLEGVAGLRPTPVDGGNFLPHVSIARFSSAEGLPRLKEALGRLRANAAGGPGFMVRDALLVRAHLGAEAPRFETVAAYPLRG
jgi:2'-5' RNA ligase